MNEEEMTQLKDLLLSVSSRLDKLEKKEVTVIKQMDTEKRLFTACVLVPEEYDSQGHIYSEEVVEKACHDYNEFCRGTDLQHMFVDVEKMITPVESWITPSDMKIGETGVKKGSWIMTARIDNDLIWEECKKGTFTGWSVACKSLISEVEEDE